MKLGCSRHNNNSTCGAVRMYDGPSVSSPMIKEFVGDNSFGGTNIVSGGRYMTISLTAYRLVVQSARFIFTFRAERKHGN